jgi:hypothetical protein
MNFKKIRNVKLSINVCHWWLVVNSFLSCMLLVNSSNWGFLDVNVIDLDKINPGYSILKCIRHPQSSTLIVLSIILFSYGSSKSSKFTTKEWDNSFAYFTIYRFIIFSFLLVSTLYIVDNIITLSSYQNRNPLTYDFQLWLFIQFIVVSILSIYVRNYKHKVFSDLEEIS